jgi:glyoxalase protein
LVDTSGGLFGAIEPYSEEAFIAAGEPGTPVWHELTCTNHYEEAAEFYRDLFDWVTRSTEAGGFRYTTALVDGAPFAGIWDAQGRFPREVPSFWQSYVGVKNVDEAVSKAEKLGGEVVREPWESEFGRMAVVADSTGATVTIAEVDEPVVEGHESDPLEGIDLSQYGL